MILYCKGIWKHKEHMEATTNIKVSDKTSSIHETCKKLGT